MDIETLALKLQETTDRSERNEGRIRKLENEHEVLHQLANSVAVMAEKLDTMTKSVNGLTAKVDEIENKPGKRWDSIVDKVIWAFVGAAILYMLGNIGL